MASFIKDKIIGTWKLVSWQYEGENGEIIDYLGEKPVGVLMYDENGLMNAQLMRSSRPNFAQEAISGGTLEEMGQAFGSYLAYFGSYIEKEPGAIVHTVIGSLFPNWIGHQETRYGQIEGDNLILSTPPIPALGRDIVFYIRWQRVTGQQLAAEYAILSSVIQEHN